MILSKTQYSKLKLEIDHFKKIKEADPQYARRFFALESEKDRLANLIKSARIAEASYKPTAQHPHCDLYHKIPFWEADLKWLNELTSEEFAALPAYSWVDKPRGQLRSKV